MKIDEPRGGERPEHATHDQLLVVRFATGDTIEAETAAARELIANCPDCRVLASDVLAIARATADLPNPLRRRDFRISPEQAARLHRPALLRWATRLTGGGDARSDRPGHLAGLQRLAGAAVAVGLVMALVTSPAGIPGFATGSATLKSTGQAGQGVAGTAAPGLALNPNAASASAALPAASAAPAEVPAASAAAAALPVPSVASAAAPPRAAASPFAASAVQAASPAPSGPASDRTSAGEPPSPLTALGPLPSTGALGRQPQSRSSVPGGGPTVAAWQAWLLVAIAGLLAFVAVRLTLRRAP